MIGYFLTGIRSKSADRPVYNKRNKLLPKRRGFSAEGAEAIAVAAAMPVLFHRHASLLNSDQVPLREACHNFDCFSAWASACHELMDGSLFASGSYQAPGGRKPSGSPTLPLHGEERCAAKKKELQAEACNSLI
jgi:hypothetical protein